MLEKFNQLSIDLTKKMDKQEKKKFGIYFTPQTIIEDCIDFLQPYFAHIQKVLEPSCGSGEFIETLIKKYDSDIQITGIEYNKTIFDQLGHLEFYENIELIHADFLNHQTHNYDLIIGNPPYFFLPKKDVETKYHNHFDGRPNIFILFILKSLELLSENGILCFVLPRNFLTCLYYDKTRRLISETCNILNIVHYDNTSFLETAQETIVLILQKGKTNENNDFVCKIHDYTIFGIPEHLNKIKTLTHGSTTLKQLNCNVSIGNIVWNQQKSILTTDETKTRLIYSSDIKDGLLIKQKYKNSSKLNYIDKPGIFGQLLVINRGYGVGNYKMDYCLIDGDFEYLVENHLICIKAPENEMYQKIIDSLNNEKTKEFICLYFGNNAINKTELWEILPVYF